MAIRQIKEKVTGKASIDGAGVHLVRVLSRRNVENFDPFLMLDAFDSTNPDDYTKGFPLHPHRGIETVTYLIEGEIEHMDSLGNKGVIYSGSCQWMTAGSGILHQEMPKASPRMLGLQLWVNLAAEKKMTAPAYRDITPDLVTKVEDDNVKVAIVAGEYNGQHGGTKGEYIPVTFLDVTLKPGKSWSMPTKVDENLFVYTILGECAFGDNPEQQAAKQAILFSEGDTFKAYSENGARFVLVSGKPLREPVAWGGPIVMNTQAELKKAFDELDEGTFIKNH
jgi:redox-sensitive bicupin YhaK (pirin superfamily)